MSDLKTIPKTALNEWIQRLRKRFRVVGPRPKKGQFIFAEIETAAEMALDYPTTCVPPKKYLFPQQETLLQYHLDGSHIQAVIESEPTVIFGIHTCDVQATRLFDQIFSQGFTDQHYHTRREDIYLISIECMTLCSEHAYCHDMGTSHLPEAADLHLTDLGDVYAVHINTAKGESLIADTCAEAFSPTWQQIYETVIAKKQAAFHKRLDFAAGTLNDLLHERYRSELWQEIGDKCLVCGMCTQVCPTCVCFNVVDEANLMQTKGQRTRHWDSCQATTFALVAGGHNFREARMARQRHRFMRKGKYMHDAYGLLGCVGCGRCGETCLVNITPIEVLNTLYQEQNSEPFVPENELELSHENITARSAGVAVDLHAGTSKDNGRSHAN
jgi:formate hydrogenlyase subunit 6/NADH:ubiquinone oxidoreductase subunit I